MRLRWVLAAFGVAAVGALLTVAALLRYVLPQVRMATLDVSQYTQEQLDAWSEELNSGWAYINILPWLAAGTLISVGTAVALLARATHLRQRASASATASRDAS